MTEPAPIGGATFEVVAMELLAGLLARSRLPLDDEKLLQQAAEDLFKANDVRYMREFHLSDHDIVDFLLPGSVPGHDIAVEFKIKGSRFAIYRQCARYCGFDVVSGLILATSVAMALPTHIHDKPCFVARLGEAWL